MNFYYVYVLYNAFRNFIYIGYSEDLRARFIAHNNGEVTSTKAYKPFELIHYEAYKNMKCPVPDIINKRIEEEITNVFI